MLSIYFIMAQVICNAFAADSNGVRYFTKMLANQNQDLNLEIDIAQGLNALNDSLSLNGTTPFLTDALSLS